MEAVFRERREKIQVLNGNGPISIGVLGSVSDSLLCEQDHQTLVEQRMQERREREKRKQERKAADEAKKEEQRVAAYQQMLITQKLRADLVLQKRSEKDEAVERFEVIFCIFLQCCASFFHG